MTNINTQATTARETARSTDGKFGHQEHDRAAGVDLMMGRAAASAAATARTARREKLRADVVKAREALDVLESQAIAEATEESVSRIRERYGAEGAYLVVAHDDHRSEQYVQVLDEDGTSLYDRQSYAYFEDIAEPQRVLGVDLANSRPGEGMGTAGSMDFSDTEDGDEIVGSLDLRPGERGA